MLLGVIFRRVYVYIWKFNLTVLELDFWADSHTNVYILHMGKNSISSNLKKKSCQRSFLGLKEVKVSDLCIFMLLTTKLF
jgi:hypothetical protein